MPETGKRGGGRGLIVGVLLIALVTAGAVFGFRRYEARRALSDASPRPTAAVPAPAASAPAAPAVLAPAPPLGRTDILSATTAAASAYAAGEARAPGAPSLVGRRFRVVLPFGCDGPRDAAAEPAAYWEYGPERRTIRIRVRPEDWTESDFARGLGSEVERVEGFWIPRPWLASDDCPAPRTDPLATAAPAPSPETVGLARVFESGGSRLPQRGGRPYEVTLSAPEDEVMPAPAGYRLVLEGRVTGFEGGEDIACRSGSPEQRPVCLVGVEIDRVAITDPADASTLGEWRS